MKKSEEVATYHYNLAVQYEKEGRVEEAKKEYQYAAKCDLRFAYPHKGLGELYYREGNIDMAVKELAEAIAIDPAWDEALALLAEVFYAKREIHKAIHFQERALKSSPDNPVYNATLGKMYISHKKYDEAIDVLRKAVEKDSNQYAAKFNLGLAYAKRGARDLDNSLETWKEALKLKDDDINLYRNVGIIYYMKGLLEEAIDSFKKALSIEKNDEVSKRYLELSKKFMNKEEKKTPDGNNPN